MLFSPQMAHLLATSRRRATPAAPRRRRALLRGLRFPRRTATRARWRPGDSLAAELRRPGAAAARTRTGTRSVETSS